MYTKSRSLYQRVWIVERASDNKYKLRNAFTHACLSFAHMACSFTTFATGVPLIALGLATIHCKSPFFYASSVTERCEVDVGPEFTDKIYMYHPTSKISDLHINLRLPVKGLFFKEVIFADDTYFACTTCKAKQFCFGVK